MQVKIRGEIKYKVKKNHPDLKYIPEGKRDEVQEFDDVYYIDMDYFEDMDAVKSYIKHDLALVAGGGYATDTIKNVSYKFERLG